MKSDYSSISIPQNLKSFCMNTEIFQSAPDSDIIIDFPIEVHKDSRGRIQSVCYFTPEGELEKQIFYNGMEIGSINYFNSGTLYKTEKYEHSLVVQKDILKKNGDIAYNIRYYYKNGILESICKKSAKCVVHIKYLYDELDRIVCRKISVNDNPALVQEYSYDILDRIVLYKDERLQIRVRKISKKNELLSYVITDRIGNEIIINNLFTDYGYVHTEVSLNGHGQIVKDTSYVDNIMLKKPYASEEDLDLIISNLFNTQAPTQRKEQSSQNPMGIVDSNIEIKTLPISIRKRLLFNLSAKPAI